MRAIGSVWRWRCPSGQKWAALAADLTDEAEATRLLSHAAACSSCARTLKETTFLLRDGEQEPAGSPELDLDAKIPSLAAFMAGEAAKPLRSRTFSSVASPVMQFRTVAVPGIAAAALAVLWLIAPSRPPLAELAEAYSAQRTVELRVPGAPHAPLRISRSGRPSEAPPELLESQAEIQRHLERKPADADWLHAWGRAQVLTWQFDGAIQSFEGAAASGASSPEFRIDFATAYFQRAEARRNPADYDKAIEQLSRALGDRPRDPVTLFNRGIVYGKLSRRADAIRDLEQCLQVESDNGWKEEAKRRIEDLRQWIGKLFRGQVSSPTQQNRHSGDPV